MKQIGLILVVAVALSACTTKKTETTGKADTVAVDSTVLADKPAPAMLAFSEMNGFFLDNKVVFTDTVNFFLLSGQEELDKKFSTDKTKASEVIQPDFLINYVVAVACMPTQDLTTIVMEKVEVGDQSINVYFTIQRGEKQKFVSKPSKIFSIERRDGFSALQFYVNGKMDKSISLAADH